MSQRFRSCLETLSGPEHVASHAQEPRERFRRYAPEAAPGDREGLRDDVFRLMRISPTEGIRQHTGVALPVDALERLFV